MLSPIIKQDIKRTIANIKKETRELGGKTLLISGGAGFIGSHLCGKLLERGNEVICVDNLVTGNRENIKKFLDKQNFKFIEHDVLKPFNNGITRLPARQAQQWNNIDFIYHLASPASVTYIMKHPRETAMINFLGTKNLLDLAKKYKAKFLFTSSSEVYGDPKEHPQKESYWGNVNPIGVRSGYDEGKRVGETLCMAYKREFNLDVKIVRIFNTYGPHSSPKDSRVVPRFVTQALRGKPLTIHGNGQQTRSFCYVSDMVEGLIKMMESKETGPVNLGSPEEFKIVDLAKKIIKMTNSKSKIIFVERPEDDPSKRKPDITLAKQRLAWQPKVSLDKGLKMTIDYFRKILT